MGVLQTHTPICHLPTTYEYGRKGFERCTICGTNSKYTQSKTAYIWNLYLLYTPLLRRRSCGYVACPDPRSRSGAQSELSQLGLELGHFSVMPRKLRLQTLVLGAAVARRLTNGPQLQVGGKMVSGVRLLVLGEGIGPALALFNGIRKPGNTSLLEHQVVAESLLLDRLRLLLIIVMFVPVQYNFGNEKAGVRAGSPRDGLVAFTKTRSRQRGMAGRPWRNLEGSSRSCECNK
jgi:hypothetical protein